MARDRVYFLSDLHLGAPYIADGHAAERRVARFLSSISDKATDVYLLGDILDYWYEYRTVAPRGHVRLLGALASLADSGVRIHWGKGNHDIWLFDYLKSEIGMEVVDEYSVTDIMGKRFFLAHGDGLGPVPRSFRFLRGLFRSRVAQFFFAGVHPRWTVPFARWACAESRDYDSYATPEFKGIDKEPQAIFARDYLRDVDPTINYFVMGHLHTAVDVPLSPTSRLIVLGDWITQFTYAVFDGNELKLERYRDENDTVN